MCLKEGVLQAYLDQELSAAQRAEVEACLTGCEACRQLLEVLKSNDAFVAAKLEAYASWLENPSMATNAAWARFYGDLPAKESKHKFGEVWKVMKRYRLAAVAGVVVMALAASFSFSSVRSFAGEILTVFRVNKVQTINIDPQEIARLQESIEKGTGQVNIDNFGKIELSNQQTSEEVSLEQAGQAVDFPVKLPVLAGDYKGPVLQKSSAGRASFTLDIVKANSLLSSLGSQKLLPEELDQKTFTLTMPVIIGAQYTFGSEDSRLLVAQARSPEMSVPEGVSVEQIRDTLLSVPVLPDSLRQQLASVNDWQHTILIPNIDGNSQEVMVNGVQGVFTTAVGHSGHKANERNERSLDERGHNSSALIWQKDGVIYAIAGNELTLDQSLSMASSMK
jgi:hypothetical protein